MGKHLLRLFVRAVRFVFRHAPALAAALCLALCAQRYLESRARLTLYERVQEQQAFNQALALYYEKISKSEMPYWAKNGINFRLPQPGLLVKDGNLYANVAIDGAEVRYTTDGSEPTAQSTLWKEPVKCGSLVVKAKTFYQGKESLTIILNVE